MKTNVNLAEVQMLVGKSLETLMSKGGVSIHLFTKNYGMHHNTVKSYHCGKIN